jgi:tetraacyldisaccharide 4'-kinase
LLKNNDFPTILMPLRKLLFYPFALLYKLVTDFRNHLYDIGYRPSVHFDRLVIGVGNLTVGGTGKTPFVELLVRVLKSKYAIAALSRGYGRKTKGFRIASADDSAQTLGDEPYQYFTKFGDDIAVAVGEDRALAIPELLLHHEGIEIILLDDAFQHRRVQPHLNILLNDYHRPFYKDFLMPAGWLRESRTHARRADVVVVTKCPAGLADPEMETIASSIRRYAGSEKSVFFSTIRYLEPKRVFGEEPFDENIILFSGIAQHEPLEAYVRQRFKLLDHIVFPDHHHYSVRDIEGIIARFHNVSATNKSLLTTEKDMVRLLGMKPQLLQDYSVFYLPIELYFLKNEDFFVKTLLEKVNQS